MSQGHNVRLLPTGQWVCGWMQYRKRGKSSGQRVITGRCLFQGGTRDEAMEHAQTHGGHVNEPDFSLVAGLSA